MFAPAAGPAGTVVRTALRTLQALDPSVVSELSGTTRATASFVLTIAFGGLIIYRYGNRLDAAVDASVSRPITSVVYGLIAFGIVIFFLGYVFTQLSALGVARNLIATVAVVTFGVVLFGVSAAGFVVVGSWVATTLELSDPFHGLVAVGVVTAVPWLVFSFAVGAAVWVGTAAVGLGGPARLWLHATHTEDPTEG